MGSCEVGKSIFGPTPVLVGTIYWDPRHKGPSSPRGTYPLAVVTLNFTLATRNSMAITYGPNP
jgi:hypothetical protein